MSSNSGGPSPWGQDGPRASRSQSDRPPPDDHGGNDDPWGPGADPGGPRRPGRPGPQPIPDLEEVIARAQAAIRRGLGSGPGKGGLGLPGGRALALIGLGVVALWLASGFYRVQPDEEGVVLRFGALNRITPPGLNYHMPWPVESVATPAVTRINRIEIGYRSAEAGEPGEEARDVGPESLMLTGDENIIDINVAVLWRIDNVTAFLFNTREPETTVRAVTESVLREVMGRTPIQPALGPLRAQVADDVTRQTQQILDGYHAGVQIVQVLLQKVDPPAAVVESFRDVQRANTDAERMRNEAKLYRNDIVPRARGEAARIIALAEGDKQAAVARATGESKRFLSVLAAYQQAKDVTLQRLYIETMEDVMSHAPTVVLDSQAKSLLPLLPLGGPGQLPAGGPAAAPSTPRQGAAR